MHVHHGISTGTASYQNQFEQLVSVILNNKIKDFFIRKSPSVSFLWHLRTVRIVKNNKGRALGEVRTPTVLYLVEVW